MGDAGVVTDRCPFCDHPMTRERGTIACEFCWQYAVPEAVHDLGVAVGALRVSLAEAFRPMAEAMARAVEHVNAILGGAP